MFRSTLQPIQLLIITMGLFSVVALTAPKITSAQGGGADSGNAGSGFTRDNSIDGGLYSAAARANQNPTYNTGGGGGGADSGQAAATTQPADTSAIDLGSPIYNMLFAFVVTVFGKLFSWSGALFDMGLSTFVLGFGDLYYNQNIGVSVEEVWKIIRDLFNLTFIFGLVMIGFKMILDSNDSKARSTLVSLIGAALLVNFSLFITKFVIDIANVTASVVAKGFGDVSIANGFINLIKISTFLNIDSTQIAALQTGGAFGYIFGLLIFFAVAAFVFAAGGILMIIRFVVLCAYMVFSPVMFIGWVFPSLGKHSSKYWSGFLGQAFFAPAYLLMLYLSFKVMASYRDQIGVVDYGQLFASGPELAGSAARVIPFFVMTMVFLVMSLVVAKNMGAVGASTAISIGDKLVGGAKQRLGYAAGAPVGMLARVGRNTVGAMGNSIATNENRLELAAQRGLRGWTARQMIKGGRVAGDSSFDARQVASLGKTLGIGDGKKGGYKTQIEATAKADQKFAESLGMLDEKDSRVAERIYQKEAIEERIKNLKLSKTAEKDLAKKSLIEKDILSAEKELKVANEKVEREKRRRQIGGTFTREENDEEIALTQVSLDHQKKIKKDILNKIATAEKSQHKILRAELRATMADIEEVEKNLKYAKSRGTIGDGYSRVVDVQNKWDATIAFMSGRTIHESKNSASEIAKKFTKETKKTKEDNHFSSIEKAIKDSAKSDH